MAPLQPPRINTQEVEESSDDHFSSASEGDSQPPQSPIPITRVERVDDKPAYGEVPGTAPYEIRTADAVPDEIEVIPDGQRSRSGTRGRALSNLSARGHASSTPGGSPIPKTIVERVDDRPAHGEVEGTAAHQIRQADAEPDEIKKVDDVEGSPDHKQLTEDERQTWFRNMWEGKDDEAEQVKEIDDTFTVEDDAGDDFDEFAEEGNDDDFGDFDDVDQTPLAEPQHIQQPAGPTPLDGLPHLDLSSKEQTDTTLAPFLDALFPDTEPTISQPPKSSLPTPTAFLSDRSLSLWQQLVSPPPMQPPNWTRSRIRRLFLVSLGVPVDLDEILPPSKQKRLVLPNINLATSPRGSSMIERLRDSTLNDSTTSIDSKTGAPKPSKSRRVPKGPPPPPEFDSNAVALLCSTTEAALGIYDDDELSEHVSTLQVLNKRASTVLEYWLMRKDEGLREKEALEGVIENLVGFVKGRRTK